jgi:PAS domain-containing protein
MTRDARAGAGPVRQRTGGVVVGVLGAALLAVPLTNVYRDLTIRGNPLYATLLESAGTIAFAALLVAAGVWLVRGDHEPSFGWTVARWVVGVTLVVSVTVASTVGIQYYTQGGLEPLALAGDTLIVGAVGGLGVGIYNARVEQKREELRAERDRFSALFQNVPNSVVSVRLEDGDPIVDSVNPAFEEVFGFSEGELRGQNLNDYVVPRTADGGPSSRRPSGASTPTASGASGRGARSR